MPHDRDPFAWLPLASIEALVSASLPPAEVLIPWGALGFQVYVFVPNVEVTNDGAADISLVGSGP